MGLVASFWGWNFNSSLPLRYNWVRELDLRLFFERERINALNSQMFTLLQNRMIHVQQIRKTNIQDDSSMLQAWTVAHRSVFYTLKFYNELKPTQSASWSWEGGTVFLTTSRNMFLPPPPRWHWNLAQQAKLENWSGRNLTPKKQDKT